METWEKEYIRENLVSLVDEIDSNAILTYLFQSGIISKVEKDQLNILGRQSGLNVQSDKLLDFVRGRNNGYQQLTKALYIAGQTGPMITLLYGVQINTLVNPFRYCGIELKIDQFMHRKVDFAGCQITLAEICKNLNMQQVNSLLENIDVSIYKSLIGNDAITVAKDTIPSVIPYYIKRKLTLRNKLDTTIFKDRQDDYFLIENIEPYQLTKLAEASQREETARSSNRFLRHEEHHTDLTSISSEQIRALTTRFVLLEDEQHFDNIRNNSKHKSIHFITFLENNYFLVRSSKPENVKSYFLDEELHISENEYLHYTNNSFPVIIFDTPGMGKSAVLTNLAYLFSQRTPTEYVIYFEFQDLINRLLAKNCQIDISLIESEILDTISTNKFGSFINREIFNNPYRLVYLFLDAFDEVNSDHKKIAVNVVKILSDHKHSFKIYITSRPHQGATLEKICRVIGYGILPFHLQEQTEFLVEYWHNMYSVEDSDEIKEFAENLLSAFRDKVSSKDRDITGIPLQCRMLADVYGRDAQSKSYSLKNSKIVMNTIYDMYREYFCRKFPNTFLQPGKSQLLDLHFKLALELLFPDFLKSINFWQDYESRKMFSAGIIELNKSGNEQFVHRTFAEFLVAEFVGSLMYSRQIAIKVPRKFLLDFCFETVLQAIEFQVPVSFYRNWTSGKTKGVHLSSFKFKFPVMVFFLDYCISFYTQQTQMPICHQIFEVDHDLLHFKNSQQLLMASIENDSIEVHKLVSSLPRQLFTNDLNAGIFSESKMSFIEYSLLFASRFATVALLKLHYAFLSSLVTKSMAHLKYEIELEGENLQSDPILCSSELGDYQNFEFIFYNLKPDKMFYVPIILSCLNYSNADSLIVVNGKVQILKFIFTNSNASNFDIKQVSLFSFKNAHVDLLLILFAQGIDLLQRDDNKSTIAHEVAFYLSAEKYHQFVKWIVDHNYSSIFKLKDKYLDTAVHVALYKMEMKNETLEILASRCNVKFNEKRELLSCLRRGRSVPLLKKLVELGADINTKDQRGCGVLCRSIQCKNIEALKYFLSRGVNPNRRCNYFLANIWEHVLHLRNESGPNSISEVTTLLIQNGTDVNGLTPDDFPENLKWSVFKPALRILLNSSLEPECRSILNGKHSFVGKASSCMCNLCLWTCLCCTCCCWAPVCICIDEKVLCFSEP